MTWAARFRARQYLKGSLWFWPLLGGVVGTIAGSLDIVLDRAVTVPPYWQYTPSTASTVLAAIVGAMAALIGFVVTVSILVVQMATGTFSARYMRLWYRGRLLKLVLVVLVCTLTFSFSLLRRVTDDFVPDIGVTVAGFLVTVGVLTFLVYLDRVIHRLRPVAVAALVAAAGRRAFAEVGDVARPDADGAARAAVQLEAEPALVVRSERGGSIQAVDLEGLIRWAVQTDSLLVLRHPVGDFVPPGSALLEVHGEAGRVAGGERALRGLVALGVERTIEQDPAFAIRIIVDLAIKALSPAVNDPTTAVQALDHLEGLLALIGGSELGETAEFPDGRGRLRLVTRARSWEDFLSLAVTEIRDYGAGSVQVLRRLRALLEGLRETVLPQHLAAVDAELARLDAMVRQRYGDTVDLDLVSASDRQGIGGPGGAAPGSASSRSNDAKSAAMGFDRS